MEVLLEYVLRRFGLNSGQGSQGMDLQDTLQSITDSNPHLLSAGK